jgi:hypothetical protein
MSIPEVSTMAPEDGTIRLRRVVPQLIALVWIPLCFAFASVNQQFLPDKYFADSQHIDSLALVADGPSPDSFITMSWIYRSVGAFDFPEATWLITLGLFFVLLFRCTSWMDVSRFGIIEIALFCFCGAEASIYLAQYSKESLVVLIVLALTLMSRKVPGDLIFIALACGYAYTIRQYWYIVAGLYVAFRLLLRARNSRWIPIYVVIAMLGLAFGAYVFLGVNLSYFRHVVAQTNSLYAQSVVQDYIHVGGPVGSAANGLCSLVLFIIPIPLLLAPTPLYLAFAVLITVLWISVFLVMRKGTRLGWFTSDVRLARSVSLLLAMLITQAIFEPDYGSYIKHLTPLLPLFFIALKARRLNEGTDAPVERSQCTIAH